MEFPYQDIIVPVLIALGVAIASFAALTRSRKWLIRTLSDKVKMKKATPVVVAHQLADWTHPLFLFFFSLFFGSLFLDMGERFDIITKKTTFILFIILVGLWTNVAINHGFEYFARRYKDKKGVPNAVFNLIATACKISAAVILVLFILDNLNFEVSTLIAGLGIGGIAVALAVQNILQDLFASLSIVIDKPFVIGDFIIVDNYLGTVEYIGIKTTRLRSLAGEQLIFTNGDLLKSRLRNYKRMQERRIVFSIKIVYETPLEKIKKIPDWVREIVTSIDNVRFDRAHFKDMASYSLDFEVVYFVQSPSYNAYMDVQQSINLALFEKFNRENVEFAYPTSKSIRVEPKMAPT